MLLRFKKRRFGVSLRGFGLLGLSLFLRSWTALGTDLAVPIIFRGHDTGGPGEFEFLPQGKLLEYWFSEEGIYQMHKDATTYGEVDPVLTVRRFRWKQEDGGKLKFGGEDGWIPLNYDGNGTEFHTFEHTFTQGKMVVFFEALRRIFGNSVVRGKGAAAKMDRDLANEKLGELYHEMLDEAGKWARDGRAGTHPHFPRPPFHFLHTITTDGFIEYEFLPGGKLIACYDRELAPENRAFWSGRETFEVELLGWSKKAGQIIVNHYGEGNEVLQIAADGKGAFSGRGMWQPVDHLLFIPRLLAFCERPSPE